MGWTDPRTWVDGELVSSASFNTELRDNSTFLIPFADHNVQVIPFDATRYKSVSGDLTWTVAEGDVFTEQLTVQGNEFVWHTAILTSSLSGTPTSDLSIDLPMNIVAARSTFGQAARVANSAGVPYAPVVQILKGETRIRLTSISGTYAVATNTFYVSLTVLGIM